MAITINGSGTIGGISVGGLNDGIITQPELASGVASTGPAFSVGQTVTPTTLSASGYTKVIWDTENFDTNSNFASSTFTPTVAGYYQINASIQTSGVCTAAAAFYKNGSFLQNGTYYGTPLTSAVYVVSNVVYMNGSTDYIDVYAYNGNGTTINTATGGSMQFSGCLVRAA